MHWQLGPSTRIILGSAAVRPVERAASYLQSQVEKRSGWRWEIARGGTASQGDIMLGIVGDGIPEAPLLPEYPEEITLWCGGELESPSVYAVAGGPSVAMAVAGKLARSMKLAPGVAALPSLSLREHPSFPVRGHTYANHKQNNTCDKWNWEQWEEYLTEMAAWGDNVAILYPLHPARSTGCLPFGDPPWFDNPEREKEFYRQLEIQLKIPQLCHELGMRYGIWLPVNDVYPQEVKRCPELTKYGRSFVCPNIPEAREHIRAVREKIFSLVPDIDILFLPSRDDGGCPGCEDCTPWGPVYIELVKEQTEQVHKYHPDCKLWVAQQGLSTSETEGLVEWLDRERPDWVEGVAFGPFSELMTFNDGQSRDSRLSLESYGYSSTVSGPVSRLRAAVPGEYRIILYPDEAHVRNCQYPVIGMDPTVQYVWGREDGPAPRAKEMASKHAATSPVSDGTAPYSEGDTDDVNKVIWSARSWDSSLTAEQIVTQYARWFFGADCAVDATEMILTLEDILNAPLYGNPAVEKVRALLTACEARKPDLLDNWRWLNMRVGALMLDHIQQVMVRDRELLAQLRYRVAVWRSWPDPTPGLRQTIHYLERRFAETDGLLREIVWTRDRLFDLHKLAIRGVAKLQNSYVKMDVILEKWKEALERMERGELESFPERYQALVGPLWEAERGFAELVEGVQLVDHIQEFAWEKGKTTWSSVVND